MGVRCDWSRARHWFYYGALIATVLIFIVMNAFGYINSYLYKHSGIVQFFIEMDAVSGVSKLLAHLNEKEVDIKDFEVFKTQSNAPTFAVHMTVKCPKDCPPGDLMTWIMELDGVVFVEEI